MPDHGTRPLGNRDGVDRQTVYADGSIDYYHGAPGIAPEGMRELETV